jgi:hypothetical protein
MAVRKLLSIFAVRDRAAGAAAVVAVWLGCKQLQEPYRGFSGPEQFVTNSSRRFQF